MLKDLVHNWLLGGADPEVGLRLFMEHCNSSKAVCRMVSKHPYKQIQIIKTALLRASGLPLDFRPIQINKEIVNTSESPKQSQFKLRNQWPFLSDSTCPPEFKLLISDKITAYTECVKSYEGLTGSTDPVKQLQSVSELVNNFINNHEIYKELKHYADSGKVLGKHLIFEQYKRIKELRSLNTLALFDKKKNLEHAIWRNESKIKKDKREDLLSTRRSKIKELKMQLAEVMRLLE